MPQWEYKIVYSSITEEELNRLGEQGWEVVCPSDTPRGNIEKLLMKRPKTAARYSGPDYTSEDYYMGR